MANLSDMPELEDVNGDVNEDHVAVDLKGTGIDLNALREGKETFFEVDPSSVDTDEDKRSYFDQEELFKQLNLECLDDGNDSGDERTTPFTKMKRDMEDLTGDGGVLKKIIKHGAGSVIPSQSLCRVHYNAYLEYGDEPFDSSRLRGKQHQFKLGAGEVIKGWEMGVSTMKRGELSRFMFSHNYAYGKMGCPPRIPAEAAVLFEIELISFVDQGASDEFENFSEEERKQCSFDQILKVAESLRKTGNEAMQLNQVGRAAGKYSQGLRLLENANLLDEDEEKLMKVDALKLYLNLSLCDLKQARYGRACRYARKALDIDHKNIKALFRLARALRLNQHYDDARKQISKAHRLDPGNADVMDELHKLDEEMKKARKAEKDMSCKMLNLSANTKKAADKSKPKEPEPKEKSQMVRMISNRLKTFLNEQDMSDMALPNSLTEEELANVKKIAQEMGLHLFSEEHNNQRMWHVSKRPHEE